MLCKINTIMRFQDTFCSEKADKPFDDIPLCAYHDRVIRVTTHPLSVPLTRSQTLR
jgi:hypothetical protein